jgi:hypothetical protein
MLSRSKRPGKLLRIDSRNIVGVPSNPRYSGRQPAELANTLASADADRWRDTPSLRGRASLKRI